jgi:pSer/pThr/pTyr-binding forkhead associated (FHA) protein
MPILTLTFTAAYPLLTPIVPKRVAMSLTRAFLEIVDGPGRGRKVILRDGQVYYIGRALPSDMVCAEYPQMSSVHFSVRWFGDQCEVTDRGSANGTWINGRRLKEPATLRVGEDLKAGKATFRLVVEGEGSQTDTSAPPPDRTQQTAVDEVSSTQIPAEKPATIASAKAIADIAPLEPASKELLVEDMPAARFVELLASREQYLDAVRVVAHALPKQLAVAWACRCVRVAFGEDLSAAESAALAAAEAWLTDPSEERRRAAGLAADAAKQAPAGWAAMAAFWSGGSMAPPQAPVVPPGPTLTAHAAGGAIMLAAVSRHPEKAPQKYVEFLRIGEELMNGQSRA